MLSVGLIRNCPDPDLQPVILEEWLNTQGVGEADVRRIDWRGECSLWVGKRSCGRLLWRCADPPGSNQRCSLPRKEECAELSRLRCSIDHRVRTNGKTNPVVEYNLGPCWLVGKP